MCDRVCIFSGRLSSALSSVISSGSQDSALAKFRFSGSFPQPGTAVNRNRRPLTGARSRRVNDNVHPKADL